MGVEAVGVGRLEGLWGEEEAVVVVMGCQEREIGQGQGFCPAKPKTECNALGFRLGRAKPPPPPNLPLLASHHHHHHFLLTP